MENIFYVYALWASPDSGEPRYFGKGSGDRIVKTLKPEGQTHKANWLRANPLAYAEVIADNLSEAQAFALERRLIAEGRARGLKLVNSTDGGEGSSGAVGTGPHCVRTPEQHSDLSHPEGSPSRACPVILYRFETQESWNFPSVQKAAEFAASLTGKPTREIRGNLSRTKNKKQSSVYGFSCFLPKDFTLEEIARRTTDWANQGVKPVEMLDKSTGEVLRTFPSAYEASREMSINRGNISWCCNGKLKSAGGYGWKFKT